MPTEVTSIANLESIAGNIARIIPKYSLTYQITDCLPSLTPTPVAFGIRKQSGSTGFEITEASTTQVSTTNSEIFTEEAMEDVLNLFGTNGQAILEDIAANEISEDLDQTILTYLDGIATVIPGLTYDFSAMEDHIDIAKNLIIQINRIRFNMSKTLRRGLPQILVVTSKIGALISSLLSYTNDEQDNYTYIGSIGNLRVYLDIHSSTEYAMLIHKSFVPGDASVIVTPIGNLIYNWTTNSDSGQMKLNFRQRYNYTRNPLDETGSNDSVFVSKMEVTLNNFDTILESETTTVTLEAADDEVYIDTRSGHAASVNVIISSGTAQVYYTLSEQPVDASSNWVLWSKGSITASNGETFSSNITGLKLDVTVGTAIFEVKI